MKTEWNNEDYKREYLKLTKELKQLKNIRAAEFRGIVLHQMTKIEFYTNQIITAHFCKKELQSEFLYVVLSGQSFGLKLKFDIL